MFRTPVLAGLSVAIVGCGGQLEKAQQVTPAALRRLYRPFVGRVQKKAIMVISRFFFRGVKHPGPSHSSRNQISLSFEDRPDRLEWTCTSPAVCRGLPDYLLP